MRPIAPRFVRTFSYLLLALTLALPACGGGDPNQEEPAAGDTDTPHAELLAAVSALQAQQTEILERLNRTASLVDVMIKRGIMVIPPGRAWPEKTAIRIPGFNSPFKGGPVDAPVRVMVFADFECPYCRAAAAVPDQLVAEFGDQVRVFFKHNPLTRRHPYAEGAARAAIAAAQQDRFWEMHDRIFSTGRLSPEDLREHARTLGLDMEKFERALNAVGTTMILERDRSLARDIGADTTPTFYVNGKLVDGTTYPSVRAAVAAELRLLAEQEDFERKRAAARAAQPDGKAEATTGAPNAAADAGAPAREATPSTP